MLLVQIYGLGMLYKCDLNPKDMSAYNIFNLNKQLTLYPDDCAFRYYHNFGGK